MTKKNIKLESKKYYLIYLQYKNELTGEDTYCALRVIDDKVVFEGNADESAKYFFEGILKKLVDDYIEERLK